MEGITLLIAVVALVLGISAYGQRKRTKKEFEKIQAQIDSMEKRIADISSKWERFWQIVESRMEERR